VNGSVLVDDDFARFGEKSFAIDKVNSVDVRTERVSNTGFVVFLVMMIFSSLVLIGNLASPGAWIATGVFGLATWYMFKNPPKDTYKMFLTTSSSETQAFVTTDLEEVQKLRSAIERAMVERNRKVGE
jgi:hypothetical protein